MLVNPLPFECFGVRCDERQLKQNYGVDTQSGITIQDIISALSSPQVDQSVANNGVVNEIACQHTNLEGTKTRKKRAICPEDGYFPHETDCQKYYHCANRISYERSCDTGLLWDDEFKYCDHAVNVKHKCNQGNISTKLLPQARWTMPLPSLPHIVFCFSSYFCTKTDG